jgi:hypothetical protein
MSYHTVLWAKATVVAATYCSCLEMPRHKFLEALDKHPEDCRSGGIGCWDAKCIDMHRRCQETDHFEQLQSQRSQRSQNVLYKSYITVGGCIFALETFDPHSLDWCTLCESPESPSQGWPAFMPANLPQSRGHGASFPRPEYGQSCCRGSVLMCLNYLEPFEMPWRLRNDCAMTAILGWYCRNMRTRAASMLCGQLKSKALLHQPPFNSWK